MSKLIRKLHLLTALFLTPWITMYALSTLVMHHREFFTGHERRVPPEYDLVQENSYKLDDTLDSREAVAERVLADLGITGGHTVRGSLESGEIVIHRDRAVGSRRITVDLNRDHLRVERQRFGLAFFLEMLHRRRGYGRGHLSSWLWGFSVDLVITAIVLWAITGIWMWMGMKRTRKLGSFCFVAGRCAFLLSVVCTLRGSDEAEHSTASIALVLNAHLLAVVCDV